MNNKVTDLTKMVEVPTLLTEGIFGVSVNNVVHSAVLEDMIVFWFSEEHYNEHAGWDLQVPFDSAEEAEQSYEAYNKAVRKIKMKRVK